MDDFKLRKAENLKEAVHLLDPKYSLKPGDEEFFLDREESPRHEIINYLLGNKNPVKILFTGHRGSGKSTELNYLVGNEDIRKEYFPVPFSIGRYVNLACVDFIDVLIAMADRIRYCVNENLGVEIDSEIIKQLDSWADTVTKTKSFSTEAEIQGEIGFKAILASLLGRVKFGYGSDTEFKQEIKPRIPDLWNALNDFILDAENKSNKQILLVIDDLDKLDIEAAENLFYKNSSNLTIPQCSIIYTFPISICRSPNFSQIRQNFTYDRILPNHMTLDENEKSNDEVVERVRSMIHKRMNKDLFESPDDLKLLIEKSGGMMYELIRLLMDAANTASARGKTKISSDEVAKVLNNMKANYVRLLMTQEKLNSLAHIRTENKIEGLENESMIVQLLHELLVLEYANDPLWYNIHPILFDRIPKIQKNLPKNAAR